MNRRKLAADNAGLARYQAQRMAGVVGYLELLSIANIALVESAKRWPGEKNFATFATTRIIQRLKNAIRDSQRNILKVQKTNTLNQRWKHSTGQYFDDGSAPGHYDKFEPSYEIEEAESVYCVRDWIAHLPPDERQAVTLAYGIGTRKRTTGEIAKRLKLPQHVASEVIRSGLLRLRYMATCEMVNGA